MRARAGPANRPRRALWTFAAPASYGYQVIGRSKNQGHREQAAGLAWGFVELPGPWYSIAYYCGCGLKSTVLTQAQSPSWY
jgi:hypothetical protein